MEQIQYPADLEDRIYNIFYGYNPLGAAMPDIYTVIAKQLSERIRIDCPQTEDAIMALFKSYVCATMSDGIRYELFLLLGIKICVK